MSERSVKVWKGSPLSCFSGLLSGMDPHSAPMSNPSQKIIPAGTDSISMPSQRAPSGRAFGGLTVADLPPPNTKRWVIRRKAEVVAGVRSGIISLEEACRRYKLSIEEFLSWQRLIESHGLAGLRATRLQEYRAGAEKGE
jgi:hypothetical protein